MTDIEYDAVFAEAFKLISEVALPVSSPKEDALDGLKRLAGLDRDVAIMLIVQGIAAHDEKEATIPVCAFFMFLGAILSTEYQRAQRVISIEKAKRALPDETTFVDGGTCPKCGGSWVGSPTCPKCEATVASDEASKGGQ